MPRYRHALPQLAGQPILTDGGMETVLIFQEGIDLPCFAAFTVLENDGGQALLTRYFDRHIDIADRHGVGLLLETATWRANPDWVARVTGSSDATAGINRAAVDFLAAYREQKASGATLPISGAIGPRGDGYIPDSAMTAEEAAEYHHTQVGTLAATEADLITAYTLNYVEEAIGVALAAQGARIPAAISFTVETDGRLPSGQPLGDAINQVDEVTDGAPVYYLVNCAHPTHFHNVLDTDASWIDRVKGVRANASTMSHAELDDATELDRGDIADLAQWYGTLQDRLDLRVVGGCCGTDHEHIEAIATATARTRA